jgi:hypothetical protein
MFCQFLLISVYPFEASDRRIVDKDRRGELFYYMHQQVNLQQISNDHYDPTIHRSSLATTLNDFATFCLELSLLMTSENRLLKDTIRNWIQKFRRGIGQVILIQSVEIEIDEVSPIQAEFPTLC